MSKELTEKFKAGKLPLGYYYVDNYIGWSKEVERIIIKYTGLEIEQAQAKEVLAPVPSYDEYKQLVSKTDELAQKIHILNEQNTKQYNELCEEIKKNNILEKRLKIATKALKNAHKFPSTMSLKEYCEQALKEMEGVK